MTTTPTQPPATALPAAIDTYLATLAEMGVWAALERVRDAEAWKRGDSVGPLGERCLIGWAEDWQRGPFRTAAADQPLYHMWIRDPRLNNLRYRAIDAFDDALPIPVAAIRARARDLLEAAAR